MTTGLKMSECSKVIVTLAKLAKAQLKKVGKSTVPGVCRIQVREKPATKAGKRQKFGKEVFVKAKAAFRVVKAYPVAAAQAATAAGAH